MQLFIINGPFAVGKSTVAKLLHQQYPLSLLIGLDDIRRLYNQYNEYRRDSLFLVEEMSCAMARVALTNGRAVIVEGVRTNAAQIEPFIQLGKELGTSVHEIFLWSSKETVLRRAEQRGIAPRSMLSMDMISSIWDRLNTMRSQRPNAVQYSTENQSPEEIVRTICCSEISAAQTILRNATR